MPRRLRAVLLAVPLLVAGCAAVDHPVAPVPPATATVAPAPATTPPSTTPPSTTPPTPSGTKAAGRTVRYAFPVRGRSSYGRTHALYPATDIFAACGAPVVSPVDGVVLEVNRVDRFDPAHPAGAWKGGRFVSIAGDDGVRHYGAHLTSIRDTVRVGARVAAGQPIGTVGHTGNASNVCHLHYALSPLCARTGDWWLRRGVVYPWPFLDRWRAGHRSSPHASVRAWQRTHGCPAHP